MSIESRIAKLEKALFDAETYLADPDGHPIHAINLALEVIRKARMSAAGEELRLTTLTESAEEEHGYCDCGNCIGLPAAEEGT